MTARRNVVQERCQEVLFLEATEERRSFAVSRPEHELLILPRPQHYADAPRGRPPSPIVSSRSAPGTRETAILITAITPA